MLDFVDGQADLRAGIIRTRGPTESSREQAAHVARGLRALPRDSVAKSNLRCSRRCKRRRSTKCQQKGSRKLTKPSEGTLGFELLDSCWLLAIVLPEISAMKGVKQPPEYHPEGDVWVHTLLMLDGLPAGCSATLPWGVLLHDVGKPATFRSAKETGDRIRFDGHVDVGMAIAKKILERLRFSSDDTERIVSLVEQHMKFKDVGRMRPATLKRFVRLPHFDEHLALHRLDCMSSHRNLEAYEFVTNFVRTTPPEVVEPKRLMTGEDVIGLGFSSGPIIGKILAAVEEAQLNGELASRAEAISFVDRRFREEAVEESKKSGRSRFDGSAPAKTDK
jgi:poly(A) polymerase